MIRHIGDSGRSAGRASSGFPFAAAAPQRFTRYALWKDFVHDHFPWLEHRCAAHDDFRASAHASSLGECALALIRVSASEVVRTRHLAEASEAGFIKLFWQAGGELELEQGGRTCLMAAGDVAICDTARPYKVRMSDRATFAVLMFPYMWVPGWLDSGPTLCATRLSDGFTARAAVGAALANAGSTPAGTAECDATVQSLQWMLSASIARSRAGSGPQCTPAGEKFRRARQIISTHIANPCLNVDGLAAALCMSRRALYLMFERHGQTPSSVIRNMRLDKAAAALRAPQLPARKITALAYDCGFSDYASFSRLFRQRFGQPPVHYREAFRRGIAQGTQAGASPADCPGPSGGGRVSRQRPALACAAWPSL